MSRTARLFDLTDALRRRQRATSAATLAKALGVSQRTIYRDVQALLALGAPIDGEPGSGYLMHGEWCVPAPVFTETELRALALGARWLSGQLNHGSAAAAESAFDKIDALLSAAGKEACLQSGPRRSGPSDSQAASPTDSTAPSAAPALPFIGVGSDASSLRRAIRLEHKLRIDHLQDSGAIESRIVWPITLVDFDTARLLVAWSEGDEGFRHFRTDRIAAATLLDERHPRPRLALIQAWHAHEAASAAPITEEAQPETLSVKAPAPPIDKAH